MTSSYLQPDQKEALSVAFAPVIERELFRISTKMVIGSACVIFTAATLIGSIFDHAVASGLAALIVGCLFLPMLDRALEIQLKHCLGNIHEVFTELDIRQRKVAIDHIKKADIATLSKQLRIENWGEMLLMLKVND